MNELAHPIPPDDLAMYVGGTSGEAFVQQGKRMQSCLTLCLPQGFSLEGKKILDFGCGSGRVLRHFADVAERSEFWGCDISRDCIAWMKKYFQPPFHFLLNSENPPLPFKSDYFDCIYACSVFSHLPDSWEGWLEEIRRILKPEGIALISYMSRTAHEYFLGETLQEEDSVIEVTSENQRWEHGGPYVYHTYQWIIENWSPILHLDAIFREGLDGFQSVALLRKTGKKEEEGPCRPALTQPFIYCESRVDFKGDMHLYPDSHESWLSKPGIPVQCGQRFTGWFSSMHVPIVRLEAHLDGEPIVVEGSFHIERKDVREALAEFPYSLHSGFDIRLGLDSASAGIHELRLIAVDRAGNRLPITAQIRIENIPNRRQ